MGKVEFIHSSSHVDEDRLQSFVLEAEIEGQQIANVLCLDGKWQVAMMSAEGNVVYIDWQDFLEMVHRFSEFVAQENEIMLKEARDQIGVE